MHCSSSYLFLKRPRFFSSVAFSLPTTQQLEFQVSSDSILLHFKITGKDLATSSSTEVHGKELKSILKNNAASPVSNFCPADDYLSEGR